MSYTEMKIDMYEQAAEREREAESVRLDEEGARGRREKLIK
jgi:hypothetical protein